MIIRSYNHLKLYRTYIGDSKKEEVRRFLIVQGIKKEQFSKNSKIDWFEFRRLIITNFEDIIHVTFSRKFVAQIFSYIFMFISLLMIFSEIKILFFIYFGLSLFLQIFFQYFKYREHKEISNYKIIITLTNNIIQKKWGLSMTGIE
jgi:hypothetical protein